MALGGTGASQSGSLRMRPHRACSWMSRGRGSKIRMVRRGTPLVWRVRWPGAGRRGGAVGPARGPRARPSRGWRTSQPVPRTRGAWPTSAAARSWWPPQRPPCGRVRAIVRAGSSTSEGGSRSARCVRGTSWRVRRPASRHWDPGGTRCDPNDAGRRRLPGGQSGLGAVLGPVGRASTCGVGMRSCARTRGRRRKRRHGAVGTRGSRPPVPLGTRGGWSAARPASASHPGCKRNRRPHCRTRRLCNTFYDSLRAVQCPV